MNRSQQIRAVVSVVVLLLAVIGLLPTIRALSVPKADREAAKSDPALATKIAEIDAKAIRRGLDLKGGMYLVLEVDQTGMTAGEAQDALVRVKEILYNRINKFGVSEPEITTFGSSRIVVKLPGLQDPERAKRLLGQTARLEFRMVRSSDDIQAALDKMDQVFMGKTVGAAEGDAAGDPAAGRGETAVAATDSAATDTTGLDDLDALLGGEEDTAAVDAQYMKDHPFSGLVVRIPSASRSSSTPVFVNENNVARVQAMLDDPLVAGRLRGLEFQMGMEPVNMGQGRSVRPLYLMDAKAVLTGDQLVDATSTADSQTPGNWEVNFTLNSRGARVFAKVTGENVGRYLAISLDGRVSSAPVIQGKIPSGSGVIQGRFSNAEASDLALLLRAGALPVDVFIAEERTVGPSLGSDSIHAGVNAALYGSVLVIIFIVLYYKMTGVITDIALLANILILMAVLAQFDLVLTLPGIAGIILTVGMAVDANVLINERVREVLHKGKTIKAAVQSGYQNATRTIVDANVTTLIAGVILLWFGTGPIKGFAVTLSIGILSSMFTALVMTRALLELLVRGRGQDKMSI